jgi:hypothetical protein
VSVSPPISSASVAAAFAGAFAAGFAGTLAGAAGRFVVACACTVVVLAATSERSVSALAAERMLAVRMVAVRVLAVRSMIEDRVIMFTGAPPDA